MTHSTSFTPAFEEVKVDQITESRISSVVAMLPTSLQSGPIRFLRRSISLHTLRRGTVMTPSRQRHGPLSEVRVPALEAEQLSTQVLTHEDMTAQTEHRAKSGQGQHRPRGRVLYSESVNDEVARAPSGVHWKFARQGSNLVNISLDGGKAAVAEEDIVFERKAFIDGVTYLLKALPQDLDECECKRLQDALPKSVTSSNIVAIQSGIDHSQPSPNQARSILHRGVQLTVVNLVLLLGLLMPYLMYLLRSAARLERRYKVSEIAVSHGVDLVNSIGKQSAILTETVSQMNDGKVGQALVEAFVWTVQGVTQGVSDGLCEGLSMLGAGGSSGS